MDMHSAAGSACRAWLSRMAHAAVRGQHEAAGSVQVTTPTQQQQQALAKSSNGRGGAPVQAPEAENTVAEVLENTLWNRQLGVMSEEIVAALVCQIFEGAL